ncbi:transcriptional regulator [Amycolatopsis sp. NBC_00345]|uniref:transcriptional regulator n=1 Tax=Amycolatopsis sp. NBC_00345 TaxID=2975955 RepID=UPI002E273D4B
MTVPDEAVLPAPRASEDDLLIELRERLEVLAREALAKQEQVVALAVPAPDREREYEKIVAGVVADADDALRDTNHEILGLSAAREALAKHLPSPEAPRADPRDPAGHAAFGFVLWLGIGYPLLWWELNQTGLTGFGWFLTVTGLVAVAVSAVWYAARLLVRAGRRLGDVPVETGGAWALVTGFTTLYLLLLWRLGPSSREALGGPWSVVVWVVAGLAAAFVVAVASSLAAVPPKDGAPARRPPGIVIRRGLAAAVLAAAVAFLVLQVLPLPVPPWARFVLADAGSLVILIGAAPLSLRLIPAAWSRDPARRGSPGWNRRLDELAENLNEAQDAWAKAARGPVRVLLNRHLDKVLNPAFTTTLRPYDHHALGQMRAGDRAVTTIAIGDRLRALLAGIESGAVGMAGPRGAGKSTLLEAYRDGKFLDDPHSEHIALWESVPVRYDAREFVLHLYARTCGAVAEFCERRGAAAPPGPARRAGWRRVGPFVAVALGWAAAGVAGSVLALGSRFDLAAWSATLWWPLVCLLGASSLLYLAARRGAWPAPSREPAPPPVLPGDVTALRARAEWALDDIRFQQKHTSGWSGKVGVAGAEAGVTGSRELTRQPKTYPEIVHEFGVFLQQTSRCLAALDRVASPSLVIILDELDKIAAPDVAQDFINEVKGLLTTDVPGLLFLVSVSEDALAAFERRGLPVRDAFDSAFDLIIRLEYLDLADARLVLSSRVVGLPQPFICLCHCLSGGLPRELIRVARQVLAGDGELADVAARVVAEDLAAKRAGLLTVISRGGHDDALVSDLVRHINAHAGAGPGELIAAAETPPITTGAPEHADLLRLQTETLGYLYYLGTVLEVFGPAFAPADLDRGATAGDGSFDSLASARQLFPVNARLAWLTITAFRECWGQRAVPPPSAGVSPAGPGPGAA